MILYKRFLRELSGGDNMVSKHLESHFDEKMFKNMDKKLKIAQRAVEMIPEKGVVVLDSGTTTLQIAKLLKYKSDLVIITNSLIVAQVLENSKNKLLLTGGELRSKSMNFIGGWAIDAINSVQADIAFVGCSGFCEDGPCNISYSEIEVKKSIIENSKEVVLVTDSSKFEVNGLYKFGTFDKFNCLITDENIDRDVLKGLSTNINVSVV